MTTHVDQATIDKIAKEIAGFGADTKALSENTNRSLGEMRAIIDTLKGSVENADAVSKERIDRFATEIETKQAKLEGSLETLQAALDRPGAGWTGDAAAKEAEDAFNFHKVRLAKQGKLSVGTTIDVSEVDAKAIDNWNKHYSIYLRRDNNASHAAEFQAAMQTGVDPDGGYLVPTINSGRIISRIFETSPIRQFAEVMPIAGKEMTFERNDEEAAAGWVGETEPRTETTTPKLGVGKIAVHEMYAQPKVTQVLLEDAGVDVEAWLDGKVGDKFGRLEATAFINGDGNNKPRGFLTYPHGTSGATIEQVNSGSGTAITSDAIWNLVFALKDGYSANARHFMRRTTVRDVVKMKDGQGNYLWSKGDIVAGQPATLADYPVVRCEDMPSVAAGALAIAFGNMRAAYTILDRLGISVLRDALTAKPHILFYSRRRVGGDVVDFDALKFMTIAS